MTYDAGSAFVGYLGLMISDLDHQCQQQEIRASTIATVPTITPVTDRKTSAAWRYVSKHLSWMEAQVYVHVGPKARNTKGSGRLVLSAGGPRQTGQK
jgi:hypothetical protein